MNKTLKNILIVLAIGFAAYAAYAIYTAFKAGEKTISSLLLAPFTAFSSVLAAVKNLLPSWVPGVNKSTGGTPGDDAVNAWMDMGTPPPASTAPPISTVFNTDSNGNPIIFGL